MTRETLIAVLTGALALALIVAAVALAEARPHPPHCQPRAEECVP